jgi:GGDEF domain-containing protein
VFYKTNEKNRITKIAELNEDIKKNIDKTAAIDEIWRSVVNNGYNNHDTAPQDQYDKEILVKLFDDIKSDLLTHIEKDKKDIDNVLDMVYYGTVNSWFQDVERHVKDTKTPLLSKDGAVEVFSVMLKKYKYIGVIFLDISCFKMFNDVLDHKAGDEYLNDIGNLLAKLIAGTDIYDDSGKVYSRDGIFAARDGGDEFYIFIGMNDNKARKIDGKLAINFICDKINKLSDEKIRDHLKQSEYRQKMEPELKKLVGKIGEKKWQKGLEVVDGVISPDLDEPETGLGYRYTSRSTEEAVQNKEDEKENPYISFYTIGKLKHHTRIFSKVQFNEISRILSSEHLSNTKEETAYIIAKTLAESVKFEGNQSNKSGYLPDDYNSTDFKKEIEAIFSVNKEQ